MSSGCPKIIPSTGTSCANGAPIAFQAPLSAPNHTTGSNTATSWMVWLRSSARCSPFPTTAKEACNTPSWPKANTREGLDERVKWQALNLHVEDGRQVTAEYLDPLLALAKAQDGRVGFEASRIASGVEAYAELQARHQSKDPPPPTLARVSDIRPSIGD